MVLFRYKECYKNVTKIAMTDKDREGDTNHVRANYAHL